MFQFLGLDLVIHEIEISRPFQSFGGKNLVKISSQIRFFNYFIHIALNTVYILDKNGYMLYKSVQELNVTPPKDSFKRQ